MVPTRNVKRTQWTAREMCVFTDKQPTFAGCGEGGTTLLGIQYQVCSLGFSSYLNHIVTDQQPLQVHSQKPSPICLGPLCGVEKDSHDFNIDSNALHYPLLGNH
ncbi:uncharacterized protein LOC119163787 isoform X1 [Rhipicephalus microplus]|uniref:uncharacterized protein LOC119163787 isoform X1 n=1 Tax=Rhipicephalus microplus TaxID=6941 RepID=UPI003F6C3F9B